jgi:hypothetical protein
MLPEWLTTRSQRASWKCSELTLGSAGDGVIREVASKGIASEFCNEAHALPRSSAAGSGGRSRGS